MSIYLIVGSTSQRICVLNHLVVHLKHIVQPKYIQSLFVKDILIKPEKKNLPRDWSLKAQPPLPLPLSLGVSEARPS